MNVCYDKKIAVLYFCIEGEPYLYTPPNPPKSEERLRLDGADNADQSCVTVCSFLCFCFVFTLPDEPHCHVVTVEPS